MFLASYWGHEQSYTSEDTSAICFQETMASFYKLRIGQFENILVLCIFKRVFKISRVFEVLRAYLVLYKNAFVKQYSSFMF